MVGPYIIGISGGTCSGKKKLCEKIKNKVIKKIPQTKKESLISISMSCFYTEEVKKVHENAQYNFDHPSILLAIKYLDSFNEELIVETLKLLKDGQKASLKLYNIQNPEKSFSAIFRKSQKSARFSNFHGRRFGSP
ncbi:hypothetical protein MXB_4676, partial [Myxobolus squamalis]